MDHCVAASKGSLQQVAVPYVPPYLGEARLPFHRVQDMVAVHVQVQDHDPVSRSQQLGHQDGANVARSPGNQDLIDWF